MRYIIDLSPEVIDEISKYTKTGKYRTVQDFIATAVNNQLYYEKQTEPEHGSDLTPPRTVAPVPADVFHAQIGLLLPDVGSVPTVDPPNDSKVAQWVWGQFNRIFPVKISMRILANMLKGNGKAVPLEKVQEKAAEEARRIGQILEREDEKMGRIRGELLSVALPVGKNIYKATTRFKMQFVGYPLGSREGNSIEKLRIDGAPAVLRFVNIFKENNKWMIGITSAGLRFASMTNPILDKQDFSAVFSDEERSFLVEHLRQNVKSEATAVKSLLQWIEAGQNTPEKLNDLVKGLNREWSWNEAITMRAGLISRLSELGIISRSKNGIYVTYSLTPFGKDVLATFDR